MATMDLSLNPSERYRLSRRNKLFRRIEADIKERDRKRKPGERKSAG